MISENQYYSYNLGPLPEGCQYCVKGEKLVLFVTGICPRKCYFCPVSDEKYGHDVCYANERKVATTDDIITEAVQMNAKGAGITGGDPLSRLDKTVEAIKLLKARFGTQFHIHLYTSQVLATETALQKLHDAGLDEIRFHLDLESEKLWEKLDLARTFSWDIGIELPLIPTKKEMIRKVLDFAAGKVKFVNLNELEVADNSMSKLGEMGFETKNNTSYAVQDSVEKGLELMEYTQEKKYSYSIHLCTAKLKDAVQLANRIKREAAHSRHSFDLVDEEGLLIRAAAYLPELSPGFEYRKKLAAADKENYCAKLAPLLEQAKTELHLREKDIVLDRFKPRLLLSVQKAKQSRKWFQQKGLQIAIVKEYPTADELEIEVEFL